MKAARDKQSQRFPLSARIRSPQEFSAVFKHAERYAHPLMCVHLLRQPCVARLGLAVSRKVDRRAINRNRIKRIFRETMRHHRDSLPPGDYVVVARGAASQATNSQLRAAMLSLFHRISARPKACALNG